MQYNNINLAYEIARQNKIPVNLIHLKKPLYYLFDLHKKAKTIVMQNLDLTPSIQSIDVVSQLPGIINEPSLFFSSQIKDHIKVSSNTILQYKYNITDQRHITIQFIVEEPAAKIELEKYNYYVIQMTTWITMIHNIASKKCSKYLDIYIFMSPFQKHLPESNIQAIDAEHINTAYTTSCALNTEIVIYRKEEWFKVFIHETFHNFGLDFSYVLDHNCDEALREIYNLDLDYRFYEAYTETWARIMNIFFICIDKHNSKNKFMDCFYEKLQIEMVYACLQSIKLLSFYDSQYKYFFDQDKRQLMPNLYNEKTSAFSYFVLSSCFLFHVDEFMNYCMKNNQHLFKFQPKHLQLFVDLFKSLCNKKTYMKTIDSIYKIYVKMPYYQNMRMSSVDFF